MTTTIFGIKNCDTVKKARKWLETQGVEYKFHDFREQGLDTPTLETWLQAVGTATLVNKRSTTWKQLTEAEKEKVLAGDVIDIALQNPTLIKRPVLSINGEIHVGFNDKTYTELLGSH